MPQPHEDHAICILWLEPTCMHILERDLLYRTLQICLPLLKTLQISHRYSNIVLCCQAAPLQALYNMHQHFHWHFISSTLFKPLRPCISTVGCGIASPCSLWCLEPPPNLSAWPWDVPSPSTCHSTWNAPLVPPASASWSMACLSIKVCSPNVL